MSDLRSHPEGGEDYPRTLQEFHEWFRTEEACLEFLQRLRWPGGFRCPACGGERACPTARGQRRCVQCQRQTSPTAGTIFEGTRKPLRMWFLAMWFVTNQKLGGSALGLKGILRLGSYQTAWARLHKMRHAMVRPGRDRLASTVEVDETYVGTDEEGVRGRHTEKKSIVVIAVELRQPKGWGRIRLRHVPDVSAHSLTPFAREAVEPGSVVCTDSWRGYSPLAMAGYRHEKTVLSTSGDPAHVVMPGVHRVASLLKRWLLGTHQGAVRPGQLDYYLDEFTLRFNRPQSRARGLLFYRLVQQAVRVPPTPYKTLVGGRPAPSPKG